MTLEKHDLHHEFPEFKEEIRRLKMNDAHFASLFIKYQDADHEVNLIEQGTENTSDEYLEQKKITRVHLKDTLFEMLKNEQASAAKN
jgi:uncharacterized protein YdcH (DUF465 family)